MHTSAILWASSTYSIFHRAGENSIIFFCSIEERTIIEKTLERRSIKGVANCFCFRDLRGVILLICTSLCNIASVAVALYSTKQSKSESRTRRKKILEPLEK
jgi:hypothetical protein